MSGPKQGTVTRLPVKTDSYQARCLPLTFAQLGRGSKGEGDEDENEQELSNATGCSGASLVVCAGERAGCQIQLRAGDRFREVQNVQTGAGTEC